MHEPETENRAPVTAASMTCTNRIDLIHRPRYYIIAADRNGVRGQLLRMLRTVN